MVKEWQQWLEFCARGLVWVFGITLAWLTVYQALPILTGNSAIRLVILLYLFTFAAAIVWYFDISRLYPPRKRRAKQ